LERLLKASGYHVSSARDEEEAVLKMGLHHPDLILLSLGVNPTRAVAIAKRMRERAGLGEEVPVVVFCVANLDEGAEVAAGYNIYLTRPDNFDQLRGLLSRLLRKPPGSC
jgi:DNA-binding response OmpR family regulator